MQNFMAVRTDVSVLLIDDLSCERQIVANDDTRVQLDYPFFEKPRVLTVRTMNCVRV